MPYLYVRVSIAESTVIADRIVSMLMQHTTGVLGKNPDVISIALDFTSPQSPWFVGGAPVKAPQTVTFYLDVKVTAGTNSKAEKARYLEAVSSDFETILGPIAPASYIVIDEIPADSWGFQGISQEQRSLKAQA